MEQEQERKHGAGDDEPTVLAQPGWYALVFAALGAGTGWLVKQLAHWFATVSWAPLQGPARLLDSVPEPWRGIGVLVVGTALGLLVGLIALHEELSVEVSRGRVVLTVGDLRREFGRGEVGLAFRDGKRLVLLGPDGGEIARENCDLPARGLADAFTGHGYAWADSDPYAEAYRRWVPETPGLPEGANALLKARAKAMDRSENGADLRELREELAALGVFVRDEKKRQYWRMLPA